MSATRRHPRSRRGIALILAIVVLAALLLLGLPFLSSQSSALTGIRSFRSAEQAGSTTDSALRIGLAVATTAMEDNLRPVAANDPAPSAYTQLATRQSSYVAPAKPGDAPVYDSGWLPPFTLQVDELNQAIPIYAVRLDRLLPQAFGRVPIDATTTGAPPHRQIASISIEDESGKLDPNTMSPAAWDALIRKVLPGADWNSQDVICSRITPTTVTKPDGSYETVWNRELSSDHFGELARALAELPSRLPSRRITDIDQLLLADTYGTSSGDVGHGNGYTLNRFPLPNTVGTIKTPDGRWHIDPPFGLRRPLTRSELDRLRPFLTVHQTPPGRQGLIDFGSVVTVDAATGTTSTSNQVIWDTPSWMETVYGLGTSLHYESPDTTISSEGWLTLNSQNWLLSSSSKPPEKNFAAAIHAQPVVNLNAASVTVRAVLTANPAKAVDFKPGTVLTTLAALNGISVDTSILYRPNETNPPTALPLTAWHLQDPNRFQLLTEQHSLAHICMPPVGTAGNGVFTISAAAAITDGTGRQEASSQRRQVVQALPHEHQLERRWNLQSEMHALVAQHFTSNIDTWPHPVNRVLFNDSSVTRAWPAAIAAGTNTDPDDQHGFRPMTLPSWATTMLQPNVARTTRWFDWAMDFGAGAPFRSTYVLGVRVSELNNQITQLGENLGGGTTLPTGTTVVGGIPQATNANPYGLDDLLPDGLRIRGGGSDDGRLLALPLQADPTGGVLHRSNRQVTVWSDVGTPTNQRSFDLDGRHISLWVRPESDWSKVGFVPIFETRVPVANAVGEITCDANGRIADNGAADPATANGAQQNRLSLYYDANQELLVAIIAPPTVPHTRDAGPWIGWDDPTTPGIDERCLGFGHGTTLPGTSYPLYDQGKLPPALLAPSSLPDWTGSTSPALWRITSLFRPNRILHLFSTRPAGDLAGRSLSDRCLFSAKKARWHHLQFIMGSNRPGGMTLIVDGVCGQDVLAGNRPSCSIVSFGDQCTLPALVLDQGLEATAVAKDADLQQDLVAVRPFSCHGNSITAQDLFPKRGMVRIGNEYILYQGVTATGFTHCVRGQRQDTNTGTLGAGHWPRLDPHAPGDLVVPGGYRVDGGKSPGNITPPCGRLYKGGCTLADELTNGDPDNLFVTYATLPAVASGPISVSGIPPVWTLTTTGADTDVIPLAGPGVPGQFPAGGGIVKLGKGDFRPYYYYRACVPDPGNSTGMLLTGIRLLDATWSIVPHVSDFTQLLTRHYTFSPGSTTGSDHVYLVSIRVTGADPTETGRYPQEYDLPSPTAHTIPAPTAENPKRKILNVDSNGDPIPDPPSYYNLLQVMHPGTGRIEWIWYRAIVKAPGGITDASGNTPSFFVTSMNGWANYALPLQVTDQESGIDYYTPPVNYSNRGMMRTDFVGKTTQTHLTPSDTFPAGSPVIPVQTATSDAGIGHMLTTGDVVTIIPKAQMSRSTTGHLGRPYQAVVRYSASDGHRATKGGFKEGDADYVDDAKNGYFAFAHQLPEALEDGNSADIDTLSNYELLCGPGWSATRDLSPLDPLPASALLSNAPPRLDALADGYTPGGNGCRLIIAGSDVGRRNPADGGQPNADCVLDALAAGPLPGTSSDPTYSCRVSDWLAPDGTTSVVLSDTNGLPCLIAAESPIFNGPPNGLPTVGLVRIGGEVFAYQQIGDPLKVRLVGRGLLGSQAIVHQAGEYILPLPNGPVAMLDGTIQDQEWFRLDARTFAGDQAQVQDPTITPQPYDIGAFTAPVVMVCKPDGSTVEIMQLYARSRQVPWKDPNSGVTTMMPESVFTTAPWTRGLYNTTPQSWTGSGTGTDPRPIVIGWWPRFPSALPNRSVDDDTATRMLRCRSYAWVGFPHGFRNAWFWPPLLRKKSDDPSGHLLEDESLASLAMPASSTIFNAEIRALSTGLDWSQSTPVVIGLGDLLERKLFTAPFDNAKQFGHPVDGVEMRVHWRYAKPPLTSSGSNDHAGIDQLLDIAENAGTAPVLGAVSLRCLAPSQVLATEPAR